MSAAAERLDGNGLAVRALHARLVVERVDLARPAVHEQEDDALGLGREMRLLGRKRINRNRRGGSLRHFGEKAVAFQAATPARRT